MRIINRDELILIVSMQSLGVIANSVAEFMSEQDVCCGCQVAAVTPQIMDRDWLVTDSPGMERDPDNIVGIIFGSFYTIGEISLVRPRHAIIGHIIWCVSNLHDP